LKRYYGRKSWVPKRCPDCGAVGVDVSNGYEVTSMEQALKVCYASYTISVDKHPFWRVPRWFGDCGDCRMREQVYNSNSLLSRLAPKKQKLGYQVRLSLG